MIVRVLGQSREPAPLYLGAPGLRAMRRAVWTALCLGLLSIGGVFYQQQQCANPATTSTGTENFARMCGATGNVGCGATASSTLSAQDLPPSVAVDGVYSASTDTGHQKIFHTAVSGVNWWRVDFGTERRVQRVYIRNRFDPLYHVQLNSAEIRVGNTDSSTSNTVCGTIGTAVIDNVVTCDVLGRFLFVVIQNDYLHFSELEAYGPCACPAGQFGPSAGSGACTTCPANSVSLAGAVAATECVFSCPAGQYEDTRVLNPPYARRSYSSIQGTTTMQQSLLDDLSPAGMSWSAATNTAGQWMQIDAGQPMHVAGIVTQGRGDITTQFVKRFRVEYRLLDADANTPMSMTFSMTDGLKKEHQFATPVYGRYIRIMVEDWNVHISMRATPTVKTCSACLPNQASPVGSVSAAACQCAANAFLDPTAAANRAIGLLLGTTQFSTRAQRNLRTYAVTAVFNSAVAAGHPGGRGAVTFDQTLDQGRTRSTLRMGALRRSQWCGLRGRRPATNGSSTLAARQITTTSSCKGSLPRML